LLCRFARVLKKYGNIILPIVLDGCKSLPEGIRELGYEENIWMEDGESNRRLEKTE
jgi:hypothetical protein